jgi:hypothetical protein
VAKGENFAFQVVKHRSLYLCEDVRKQIVCIIWLLLEAGARGFEKTSDTPHTYKLKTSNNYWVKIEKNKVEIIYRYAGTPKNQREWEHLREILPYALEQLGIKIII